MLINKQKITGNNNNKCSANANKGYAFGTSKTPLERERVVTKITIQLYNVIYISFDNVNFDNVRERERER